MKLKRALGILVLAAPLACAWAADERMEEARQAVRLKDFVRAAAILRPLAEEGNAEAQYRLATFYESGRGVARSADEATAWYSRAAAAGDAKAAAALELLRSRLPERAKAEPVKRPPPPALEPAPASPRPLVRASPAAGEVRKSRHRLGYAGVFLLLALLGYPLRKRVRAFGRLGGMPQWFRIHMILGLAAPVVVLVHSDFKFGPVNSAVALISMLVVSASGVAGRFIYTRIHHGLYGERATLDQLKGRLRDEKDKSEAVLSAYPQLGPQIEELAAFAAGTPQVLGARTRIRAGRLRRAFARTGAGHAEKRQLESFLRQSVRVAQFRFYEKLFSFWHLLHVPLVFVLVASVIFHILAVALY